jgi:hypothetical protein
MKENNQYIFDEELVSLSQLKERIINYFRLLSVWPDEIVFNKKDYLTFISLLQLEDIRKLSFLGIPIKINKLI